MINQGIKHPDIKTLVDGLNDSLQGNRPQLDELEMMDALSNYRGYQRALRENNAQAKRQMRNSN